MDKPQIDIMAARTEANRMLEATAAVAETMNVQVSVVQFRDMAQMILKLADISEGSFADDRHWVPLAHFRHLRDEMAQLQHENRFLRSKMPLEDMIQF